MTEPTTAQAHATFRGIEALARRCGSYCWLEHRLFGLTGGRASAPAAGLPFDPGVRVLLSEMSAQHALFALQWRARLPVRAGVDAGALVVPPPGPASEVFDLLDAEPDPWVLLAALTEQVLPRLVFTYDEHRAHSSPVNEAPVQAVLEWASFRARHEIEAGRVLLRRRAPADGVGSAGTRGGEGVEKAWSSQPGVVPAAWAS